ncbi:protein MpCYP735-like [Marchantia polymorpha subsp. ruderalis]|uniref:Cytochrome P450 n=2 Tax=Marchantia polymorpha TaxID=3197 RepID=A0A176VR63_MARPO|nr:hypothetical protein AXG93_1660s1640 [Marchantia polymorpha subsp. ruderalis]PTQ39327.1 hypothetical protein MARPO_0045s0010 [Marchantia polymorpha]PTQ39328.1 hypothetical protein MARPO_0045s0010 [Marchantia polymorpha]PTQ39329.1 hypothetical protein MARPO_0045s0010 [Marchantia polymorpha]PTQ39330.1 hypothetical protein MARPO_0045s0010 [Marchantia polymorpha]|eukprot:PTQ39327.1 hypothetical protein MARPO_0045s0010 [Marchantia polymorpha]
MLTFEKLEFSRKTCSIATVVLMLTIILYRVLTIVRTYIWKPLWYRRAMEAQGISGPTPHVLTGNLAEVQALKADAWITPMNVVRHDYVDRLFPHYRLWTQKFGPRFLFWLGLEPVIFETDPDLIKEVFSSDHKGAFAKFGPQTALSKKVTGDALFALNGTKWLHRRRAVRPVFQGEQLQGLVEPIMMSTKTILLDKWDRLLAGSRECCIEDIVPHIAALTGDVVARTLFRSSYEDSNHAFEQHKELVKLEFYRQPLPCSWTPGSITSYISVSFQRFRRRRELHASIQTTIKRMVDKAIAEESQRSDYVHKDFLSLLLAVNHLPGTIDGGFQMSKTDLTHEARSFYTAGYQAPATTLNWIMMLLANNPIWQERIYEELREVCGVDGILTMQMVNKLNNLSMVVFEALRLYTPAPETARTAVRDVQLGKLRIMKGTSISICIPKLHRLPEFWGDDANEFRPERFKDGVSAARKHPVAYMPFSYGPRYCVARTFALLEVKCIIAMIIQRFSFQLSPNYLHAPIIVGVSIQPKHGLPIVLARRQDGKPVLSSVQ